MIVLGLDPGIAIVGWGVVEYEKSHFKTLGWGTIQTPAGMKTSVRLQCIFRDTKVLIDKYKPDHISIEELFWNTNQKTGIIVSEARGVLLLCAEEKRIPISEYTPLQVKQAITGYGRADKKQVISMVTRLLCLPEPPKPDDAADALAMAVCHAHCGDSRIGQYYNN